MDDFLMAMTVGGCAGSMVSGVSVFPGAYTSLRRRARIRRGQRRLAGLLRAVMAGGPGRSPNSMYQDAAARL
jgi:hypothetical protein